MRQWGMIILAIVICGVAACGCLSQQGTDILPSADENSMYGGMDSAFAPEEPQSYEQTERSYGAVGTASSPDLEIIKTASLDLEVADVAGAMNRLQDLANEKGGYLSSSNMRAGEKNSVYATVVLRVPEEEFDATIQALCSYGSVTRQSVNAEDVTEEYIDLQARLDALTLQKEQYVQIMEKAEDIEDILSIQVEIERVQVEIERLTGRMRYLDNRVALATITVTLHEPIPVGGDAGHDFVTVLNAGIRGFLATVDGIIIVFLSLLPLLLLGGGLYGVYRWRKRTGKSQEKSGKEE